MIYRAHFDHEAARSDRNRAKTFLLLPGYLPGLFLWFDSAGAL
jgi:hypothetical protein